MNTYTRDQWRLLLWPNVELIQPWRDPHAGLAIAPAAWRLLKKDQFRQAVQLTRPSAGLLLRLARSAPCPWYLDRQDRLWIVDAQARAWLRLIDDDIERWLDVHT